MKTLAAINTNKMNSTKQIKMHFLRVITLLIIFAAACSHPNTKNDEHPILSESQIIEKAQSIHQNTLIIDAHADIATPTISPTFLSKDGQSKIATNKLVRGGIGSVVMCLAVPPGPRTSEGDKMAREEAYQQLAIVHGLIAHSQDTLTLAKSTTDIIAAHDRGAVSVFLALQNARSLENKVSSIDSFYNEGVRMFGLNHLGHNEYSDSSRPFYDGELKKYEAEEEHGGLSNLGKEAILRMNELGAIVDVSQMSKAATLQAIRLSKSPVIASHSNVRSISDVSRNLSDEEIELIGAHGGVISISAFRAYLLDYSDESLVADIKAARRAAGVDEAYSYPFELYWEIDDPSEKMKFLMSISDLIGPANIDHMIAHINYIVDRIGIDHVGIGTDFNHGSGIDGFEDAADAFNVTFGLVRHGYSAEEIEKIWSGNFLRVAQEVEKMAE